MKVIALRSALACIAIGAAGLGAGLIGGSSRVEGQPLKNCYEQIGCPHQRYFKVAEVRGISCQFLRDVRNQIFKQNGYCFRSGDAKRDYDNEGCKYANVADVPLNAFEKQNIAVIRQVEREKNCS